MSAFEYDYSDEIAEREFVADTIRGISQDGVRGAISVRMVTPSTGVFRTPSLNRAT